MPFRSVKMAEPRGLLPRSGQGEQQRNRFRSGREVATHEWLCAATTDSRLEPTLAAGARRARVRVPLSCCGTRPPASSTPTISSSIRWSDWAKLAPRDGEPFIRTVRFHLRVPEVLALTRHDRARHQTVTFSRRNLFKRDHSTCQYCGCQPGTEELTIDHVIPRSQGGQTTWENCALACVRVQRPQGQSDARPGRHEAPPRTRSAPPGNPFTTPPASASQAGRAS